MKKVIISVIGRDRPGIIAAVSAALLDQDCNIENVNQTILQSEFSGIFIVTGPKRLSADELQRLLREKLDPMGLHIHTKDMTDDEPEFSIGESEPFIIVTRGPDRKGLVAAFTRIIADYGANVTNLQAVFKGGDDPGNNSMIYEVDVPAAADQQALDRDLRKKAVELGLDISIQHRRIFKALNRI